MHQDPLIHPVILCGGSGTRLWPLSRKSYPKQFSPLMGSDSLFQATARRLTGAGYAPPVVVTTADFRFIVREQLAQRASTPAAVLIEPRGQQHRACRAGRRAVAGGQDPEAMLLVAPSDHVIPDAAALPRRGRRVPCRAP